MLALSSLVQTVCVLQVKVLPAKSGGYRTGVKLEKAAMLSRNVLSQTTERRKTKQKGRSVTSRWALFTLQTFAVIPTVLERFPWACCLIQCSCYYSLISLTMSENSIKHLWHPRGLILPHDVFLLNSPECCAELLRQDFRGHECGARI